MLLEVESLIIVPNLRWGTFRYCSAGAIDVQDIGLSSRRIATSELNSIAEPHASTLKVHKREIF